MAKITIYEAPQHAIFFNLSSNNLYLKTNIDLESWLAQEFGDFFVLRFSFPSQEKLHPR
jgi:hypothetical protein